MLSNSQYSASDYQHTLKDSVTIIGRGLHSGLRVIMTLMPADANSGYVFMRRDVTPARTLGADFGIAEHCIKIYQIL